MVHYEFSQDLKDGLKAEDEFLEMLKYIKRHSQVEFLKCHDNSCDIIMCEKNGIKEYSFEVKHDKLSEQTGNVGVEFECRGKPSGIEVTRADFIVYKIGNEKKFYCFSLKTILDMIKKNKFFTIKTGGDQGSNTKMYLFKVGLFKAFSDFTIGN